MQSLIHAAADHDTVVALATPLAVGAVALTTGLGVAAMVKAFGIGFLARPRSDAAADAREAPASMITGMVVAAFGCVVLAVAAVRCVAARAAPGPGDAARLATPSCPGLGTVLHLPGLAGSIAPGLIAGLLVAAVLVAVGAAGGGRGGARNRRRCRCGHAALIELTARMQYTATSFAEPLQRVFDDVLRPDTDIEVTPVRGVAAITSASVAYRARITDAVEDRLYTPVSRGRRVRRGVVRRAHTGSVHLYLAYGALGVLIVLVVAR